MRAIIETVFDIFYLVTVLTVGIRMIRGSKAGTQFRLFGLMAVVLGAGDSFHRSEERRVGKECRSRWSPYH